MSSTRLGLTLSLAALGSAVAAPASDSDSLAAFRRFKVDYRIEYPTVAEENARFKVFKENLRENLDKFSSTTHGVTKFSDLTDDEFSRQFLGLRRSQSSWEKIRFWDGESCPACSRYPEHRHLTLSDEIDWTVKGAVTSVKTQNCGDCYAFGSTGDIEGAWFLGGHDLQQLSEEQIIDCCYEDAGLLQCAGCSGGEPHSVFDWLLKYENGGICDETTYPYVVKPPPHGTPSDCQRSVIQNSTFSAKISGWYWVSKGGKEDGGVDSGGELNMTKALPKVGPFVIGIDAIGAKMKAYKGGIAEPDCKPNSTLNHAMLVVGYGTENGKDYWKIKNSWGVDWGEEGYYRVIRGKNACGLANDVVHSYV
jgi:hypothetical protein